MNTCTQYHITHTPMHAPMHTPIPTHIPIHPFMHTYIHKHTPTHLQYTPTHTSIHPPTRIHKIHAHTNTHANTPTNTHTHQNINPCTYQHTPTYTPPRTQYRCMLTQTSCFLLLFCILRSSEDTSRTFSSLSALSSGRGATFNCTPLRMAAMAISCTNTCSGGVGKGGFTC